MCINQPSLVEPAKLQMPRNELIKQLPDYLKAEAIVEAAANYLDLETIEVTQKAFLYFFSSDEFADFTKEAKQNISFTYQMLMQTLRRIDAYQERTYRDANASFWKKCD